MPWKGPEIRGEYPTLGYSVGEWIEEHLVLPDGPNQNEPLRLTDEMWRFLLSFYRLHPNAVADTSRPSAPFAYRGGLLVRPQKWGKALALDTPVPTPSGWTTMGELRSGASVLDEHGQPCRVVAVSPTWLDTDCYEVCFSDGERVIASGDHLWTVEDRQREYAEKTIDTRTLHDLGVTDWGTARRWRLRMPASLDLPERALPLDPYVLGAWLGDGHQDDGRITGLDEEIFARIETAGFAVRQSSVPKRRGVLGLKSILDGMGLLRSKHIPVEYLRASKAQRLALLQGLMDTDGHVEDRGRCEFTTVLPALRDGMCELLSTFGLRYNVVAGIGRLYGVEKRAKWRIQFSARDTLPAFGLVRKLARMKPAALARDKWRSRHIASIERVPTVPTVCITVDSPSSLFLVGRRMVQTHNSPFAAAICLAEAFGPVLFAGWDAAGEPVGRPQPTPWIQIVATSEEQTDNTYLALYEMASRGAVADMAGVDIGIGDVNLPSGGKIEPRSASGKARLGARLTFALFDESHLMVEQNGGVLLASTMKRNIGGMSGRWLETTNAYDPSERSAAQRTHESKAPGILVDYRPPVRKPDLEDDQDALDCLAHVYGDSWWVDRDRILADARDPSVCPTQATALRFFFNLIVVGEQDAVDATRWDARVRPRDLKPGEMVALGFDGSRSRDCTSIVASRITDGRWFHLRTWNPAEYPDHRVPRDEVDQVLTSAFEAYDVRYLFFDPYRWQEYGDVWASRWPDQVVEFPTNVDRRMDDAIARFYAVFAEGFTHDGDATLSEHAKAAALVRGMKKQPRPDDDPSIVQHFMKIGKKRATVHIDAFIAGLLAEAARGQAIEDGALGTNYDPLESVF